MSTSCFAQSRIEFLKELETKEVKPIVFFGDEQIDQKVDSVLQLMTLEEKVAMCHAQSKFSSPGVARLGIPEIWMSDGPHGVRSEPLWDSFSGAGWTNDSCTAFPALTCLAASFNPEMSYIYGKALGEEARYRKKDILLGPGLNIYRMPLNGRNFEYMGEDPYLASKMSVPYIKGVQENGVAACVKHYALNNQEKSRFSVSVDVNDRALHEIYLPAFKAAVLEGNTWSVMGAYNKYKGQYCTHNEQLNKILKGDWGFDGVLVSDWGSTHDTREAALYGLDIEMGTFTNGLDESINDAYSGYYLAIPFLRALKKGEISVEVLDDKVRRILRLIFRTSLSENRPWGSMRSQEHYDVARKIAQDGVVLLKNDDDFFPIDANTELTIAVIGDNATRELTVGGGSSELKAVHEISPLEGIQKRFKNANVIFARGYNVTPPRVRRKNRHIYEAIADSLILEAIEIAKQADVVLFVGGLNKEPKQDSESHDRLSYELPYGQGDLLNEIVKINKNTGLVLISGNAVEMPFINDVKGIMQAWYLGSEAGHAIADIISGDVNPSGKLPFSFPVKLSDNGAISFGEESYPGVKSKQEYKEGILVGYRWHDTKEIDPLFEFGYGLSFTSFKLRKFKTDKKRYGSEDVITLSCSVKNTGNVKGAEVVQVYVHDVEASVMRPLKELKAFKKVYLNPGEEKTVSLVIAAKNLAFYDEQKSDWNLEPGKFKLLVGVSSKNIVETMDIEIE